MRFDYETDTKGGYQDGVVASRYHASFTTDTGWRALRFKVVASRERALVARFLRRVAHNTILDIPAGTGKLAPVFRKLGGTVLACDISESMLAIARQEYLQAGHRHASFKICDAERINELLGARVDVAVCLRLLHRVPSQVRGKILAQLAACSRAAIVSMGVESPYHRVRRRVRGRVFGGDASGLCYASVATLRAEVEAFFVILDQRWVLPWLSQEMVFLLRPFDPKPANPPKSSLLPRNASAAPAD
jgi:SAM-dependent methyltransferase